jgi:2-polyprenyl-6-methoxyphenol hydroxylase-like FAD-dependent oxidoreductase
MRQTDVAIIGGGLAGSTAAAMLGRAGIDAALVDPHPIYPDDFRCEKLDASQVALLHAAGLADAVRRQSTIDGHIWIGRYGRIVDRRLHGQYDILYDRLVNTAREEIPERVEVLHAKATAISTGIERQHVTLSNGEELSARLVVLANGLNIGLRRELGIQREILSACHSISLGFDLFPVGRASFDFRALTYFTEDVAQRVAYLSLFPIGAVMRANLFVYREMDDPWLRRMRKDGAPALFEVMPRLRELLGAVEIRDVRIRPVDLYISTGYRQGGIVLVGDAFSTSCPAAGTGCNKVFTDVVQLCNVHIPAWLATSGMAADKIAAFYDDPVKRACDAASEAKAWFLRSLSTETGMLWRARRFGRFAAHLAIGTVRQWRERAPASPIERPVAGDSAAVQ